MPNDSLETRIKLRIHSAIGTYIVAHKLTRQELSRRMREEWKKGRWDKLKADEQLPTRLSVERVDAPFVEDRDSIASDRPSSPR